MQRYRRNSFSSNLLVLFEELKLAAQWRRPSILLAICNSRFGRIKAQNGLKDKLQKQGLAVVNIVVNSRSPHISRQVLDSKNNENIVYFVSNIDWGGGQNGRDAYRDLNLNREAFVENHIKAVIWLTKSEALNLSAHAPDFWAFRHHVVEFTGLRGGNTTKLTSGVLLWFQHDLKESAETLQDRIKAQEKYMQELPQIPEALSLRLELLYTTSYLYWAAGDIEKASKLLRSGIELTRRLELSTIRKWLLNGLAIIHYEQGDYENCAGIYRDMAADFKGDPAVHTNHGLVLCAIGKFSNAILDGKRAAKLSNNDATIWNRLGYIYLSAGKLDECSIAFKKAIEIQPTCAAFYESLAICYYLLGLVEESLGQLEIASTYARGETLFIDACKEAVQGNHGKSMGLIQDAKASGRISKFDVERNFNFQILLHSTLEEPSRRISLNNKP